MLAIVGVLTLTYRAGASSPLALAHLSNGATLKVTKTGDTNDGACKTDCSLREAIAVAAAGNTVAVPAGTYTLTLGSQLTISKGLGDGSFRNAWTAKFWLDRPLMFEPNRGVGDFLW